MGQEVALLRGMLLLLVVGLLSSPGCARRETEAQMRKRVQREERQRLDRAAQERERDQQAKRARLERARRSLLAKEKKLQQDLATRPSKGEVERLKKQLEALKRRVNDRSDAPMSASMSAPMSARHRYRSPAPAPRRRLKRPRRRRSPSLEGLFE